jgi:uncharacterized MnhB-related membrane protein
MTLLDWLFDALLGATLLWLGARALFVRDQSGAVLSFIGLGAVMALAWVRLGAPDVALAEAILGGGVTGALLLAALRRSKLSERDDKQTDERP